MAPDRQVYRQVSEVEIASTGSVFHLEGFGAIKVFKIVANDGDIEYWATNDVTMDELRRQLDKTDWPLILLVDGKEIEVRSPNELMVPPSGNLICVFEDGAFEIIDCSHVATLRREVTPRRHSA